jgi:hypothetical protein
MYCIKCGVKLADSEKVCPLCKTRVYHPDFPQKEDVYTYPKNKYPKKEKRSLGLPIFATALALFPIIITLACDLRFNSAVTWSGYVVGAVLLIYVMLILPSWFSSPNPVIFVPCSFAAAALYLFYICSVTGGNWFFPFALPVTTFIAVIITATVTLTRYIKKGRLYIFGGAAAALGLFMPLLEYLITVSFGGESMLGWSFYPMAALILIGAFLIFLAICRPAREFLERRFFI